MESKNEDEGNATSTWRLAVSDKKIVYLPSKLVTYRKLAIKVGQKIC